MDYENKDSAAQGRAALQAVEPDILAALTAFIGGDLDVAWSLLRESADVAPRMTATALLGMLDQALRRCAVAEGTDPAEIVREFCLERALNRG